MLNAEKLKVSVELVLSLIPASMKIRIPQAPLRAANRQALPPPTKAFAIERITRILNNGNVLALTGAGVSVDSGIRAYRGNDGRYMNPNYQCGYS